MCSGASQPLCLWWSSSTRTEEATSVFSTSVTGCHLQHCLVSKLPVVVVEGGTVGLQVEELPFSPTPSLLHGGNLSTKMALHLSCTLESQTLQITDAWVLGISVLT